MKIWAVLKESSVKQIMTLPQFNSSVTALSWVGIDRERNHGFLAVGMENGLIELWSLTVTAADNGSVALPGVAASLAVQLDPSMCHVSSVNRISWRNHEKTDDCRSVQLASCGADQCVRVFEVIVN